MPYGKAKIYSDGSHFIGIPHKERPYKPRNKPAEEIIAVNMNTKENLNCPATISDLTDIGQNINENNCPANMPELTANESNCPDNMLEITNTNDEVRYVTRKELFEEIYAENINLKKWQRRNVILGAMRQYFETEQQAIDFVDSNMERKARNLINRRVRLTRKVNMQVLRQNFNYFCTFTYDDRLHNEESFKCKLKDCFKKMCYRRNWKYIGVWERSPEKHRLHFHGIFYIPDGAMVGELVEVKDYSVAKGCVQTSVQNMYFNERFGRSDFKSIDDKFMLGDNVRYLMKYIEKTGERIVYGGDLPQYIFSDVMDEDVICPYGEDSDKFILRDDFVCWDEGEKIGTISGDVIDKMPKCN